jgi:hypothetical protein
MRACSSYDSIFFVDGHSFLGSLLPAPTLDQPNNFIGFHFSPFDCANPEGDGQVTGVTRRTILCMILARFAFLKNHSYISGRHPGISTYKSDCSAIDLGRVNSG